MSTGRVKVLLVKDVYKLGHVGDVVDVRPGFARNYLLPQRLGVSVTKQNLKAIEEEKIRAAEARKARLARKTELAERIAGMVVSIEARVNETGRLFGSVGRRDILQAVARKLGYAEVSQMDLPIDVVQLHEAIREPVQELPITLDLDEEVSAEVKVTVIGTDPDAEAPAEEPAPEPTPAEPAGTA